MSKKMRASVLTVCLLFLGATPAHSQQEKRFKRAMATIVFSSLGGAILGLSTLSFYSEPEQHANNVSAGAILGFVFGCGYIMMDPSNVQQKRPSDVVQPEMDTNLMGWNQKQTRPKPLFQVAFEF